MVEPQLLEESFRIALLLSEAEARGVLERRLKLTHSNGMAQLGVIDKTAYVA